MKLSITRLMMVSALAAGLHLGAANAGAQTVKFTLPVEAHWGTTVLPPGSYSLYLEPSASSIQIFHFRSDNGSRMAVPTIVNTEETSNNRSYLKLVNVDGSYYVREYVSSISGTATEFATPKPERRELRAQNKIIQVFSGS